MSMFAISVLLLGATAASLFAFSTENEDDEPDMVDRGRSEFELGENGFYIRINENEPGEDSQILGTNGNDTIIGHSNTDREIHGEAGDDVVRARGNDTALGGAGNDILDGTGVSEINGGPGDDTLSLFDAATGFGGPGDDLIVTSSVGGFADGGEGQDIIVANSNTFGPESLITLSGGEGEDHFVVLQSQSSGLVPSIIIDDFEASEDTLVVEVFGEPNETSGSAPYLSDVNIISEIQTEAGFISQVLLSWTSGEVELEESSIIVEIHSSSEIEISDFRFTAHIDIPSNLDLDPEDVFVMRNADSDQLGKIITSHPDSSIFQSEHQENLGRVDSIVVGLPGDDSISLAADTLEGMTTVFAGEGDDLITMGDSEGTVFGGLGDDHLIATGGAHNVCLMGEGGNDVLEFSVGQIAKGGAGENQFVLDLSNYETALGPAVMSGWQSSSLVFSGADVSLASIEIETTYADNGADVIHSNVYFDNHLVLQILGAESADVSTILGA